MSLFGRPTIAPEVVAQEEKWNREKDACKKRFWQAVEDGRYRDFRKCEAIIAGVRASHGDKAAEIAAAELKKAIQRDAKPKK